jgi:hypothetical protein
MTPANATATAKSPAKSTSAKRAATLKPTDMPRLVEEWARTQDEDTEQMILDLLDSEAYRSLPYIERNRPFLTASKLKELRECPYHAKLRYIDEVPSPADDKDYFVIGQAVDDCLTLGQEYFDKHYQIVARRDKEAELIQLTNATGATVKNAVAEFRSRDFFPKEPKKHNIIFLLAGMPAKAELDHFDPDARRIGDIKTTSSITTFDPMDYALQMGFYSFGIEKKWGEQVEAELYVVDKGSGWSRSHKWVFCRPTLRQQYFEIERLALTWKDCTESGIFPHVDMDTEEGRKTAWRSEYYSVCPFCKTGAPTIV